MAKKVAKTDIDKLITSRAFKSEVVDIDCGDSTIQVEIKEAHNYENRVMAITNAVAMNFADDESLSMVYGIKSLAFYYAAISIFTNINTKNVGKTLSLITNTDIMDVLAKHISLSGLCRLEQDYKYALECEIKKRSKSNKADELYDGIIALVDQIGDISKISPEDIKEVTGAFSKLNGVSEDTAINSILEYHNKDTDE